MALAQIANVQKRVIRILNANPSAWSASVSGEVSIFPDSSEIDAAILEADEMVVTKGYFQSVNPSLAEPFMTASANIPSGTKIPFHYGNHGKVELASVADFSNAVTGIATNSLDDITSIISLQSYLGTSGAFDHLYFIDSKGGFYHPATYGRVELPAFTRTSALQARQSEESLIIATAIRLLTKHATPAEFETYRSESVRGIQQLIQDGIYKESTQGEAAI